MVQEITVTLVCDFCKAEDTRTVATETVTVAIDSPPYESDLCDRHVKEVRELRALVVKTGRAKRARQPRAKRSPETPPAEGPGSAYHSTRARAAALNKVRAWAREQGHSLPSGARVPYDVHRRYNEAHPGAEVPLADGGRGTVTK
jgi:hypothetical protein